jgi:hypothetical protein
MKHLFQNFLHDRRVYRLNEQYYRNLFGKLLNKDIAPFYTTSFQNGEPFFNANPIFSGVHEGRILRIIQKETSSKPRMRTWLDQFEDMDELVISLELTDEHLPAIRRLAQQWWVEKMSKEEIKKALSMPA